MPVADGALDGSGNVEPGHAAYGGRMWTEEAVQLHANARLIDRQHRMLDAAGLGFDPRDRLDVLRLLAAPERKLGAERTEDCFSEHFSDTNFRAMWRTSSAFRNWRSAVEMQRHLLRYLQALPCNHRLAGAHRTTLNQHESIAKPMQDWLAGKEAEGTFVVSRLAMIDAQLPDNHPSKKAAVAIVQQYEKAYGPVSRNRFAGRGADALTMLEIAVPLALKKAGPGTPEFRAAPRDAADNMGRTVLAQGVLD